MKTGTLQNEKVQKHYERLEALRRDRAARLKQRRDGLAAIPRWAEIQKESKVLADSRKAVESDWEEQNEEVMKEIDSLKSQIEMAEFTLQGAVLELVKEGHPVEVVKMTHKGDLKKLALELKVKFVQTTLGL
jgi:hypothetical protein